MHIGDAILPQTGTKLTKERGSKFGAVVAPSDATEKKPQYTTTIHPVYNNSKRLGKICFLCDFWCAQNCSFRSVFGLPTRTLTIPACATRRVEIFFIYRCTSTFSVLNYCSGIFFMFAADAKSAENFVRTTWYR